MRQRSSENRQQKLSDRAVSRRRRRRRLARLLLFVFLVFGLGTASAAPEKNLLVEVDEITIMYQFDFVDWESQAIASELGRRLIDPALPSNATGQRSLVDRFLELETQIREVEGKIDLIYASSDNLQQAGSTAGALEQQLSQLQNARGKLAPQVETLLSRQIEAVLREEGFVIGSQVFPPLAFRLVDPPTALILSPRDRIENQHFVGLRPGLENSRRAEIESRLEARGDVSGYVTDIGGLGSYPTMVINTPNLAALIDIAAHEWTHNYLFTFPTNVAWGYQTFPRLTTINETTATIAAKEISRKVISRYYPDWLDRLEPVDEAGIPIPREPSDFDLAMRRIRTRVDRLLAEGKIEEAEAYMETERLKLVEQGHHLRKLNQAYFAFHGSYAFGPDSIDPTGLQLRKLRTASTSLKDFLDRVGWLNSYEDFQAWLQAAGPN
jgi:hypothetical protein